MRAVICGAGVGGLALARGLVRAGWDVLVLERDDAPAKTGGAVTLFANGFAALDRLDVRGTNLLGGEIRRMDFRLSSGRRTARIDLTAIERRTGFGTRTIPRRDLLAHLADGLPAGTVRYGCPVVDVSGDGSQVTDATGGRHSPDLLVGADGHGSLVRRSTVDTSPAEDVGWETWQGLDPMLPEIARGANGLCVVGTAGLVGLMPAGGDLVQWWFDVRSDDVTNFAEVQRLFSHYPAPVPALIRATHAAHRFRHRVHTIPDQWGGRCSTLVGDAAHVFPPSQAQGANQALEDAAVLTGHLLDTSDITHAVRSFEADRIPRVRRISALAASEVTNKPPSFLLRWAGRLTPPSIAAQAWLANIRRSSNVL